MRIQEIGCSLGMPFSFTVLIKVRKEWSSHIELFFHYRCHGASQSSIYTLRRSRTLRIRSPVDCQACIRLCRKPDSCYCHRIYAHNVKQQLFYKHHNMMISSCYIRSQAQSFNFCDLRSDLRLGKSYLRSMGIFGKNFRTSMPESIIRNRKSI